MLLPRAATLLDLPRLPPCAAAFQTSHQLPSLRRLAEWQDVMSARLAAFDYVVADQTDFHGSVVSVQLGRVTVNITDCSAGRWHRGPHHLRDGRDGFNLCYSRSSAYRFIQGDIDAAYTPGQFVLIDKGRASDCIMETDGADCQIVFARDILPSLPGSATEVQRLIDGNSQAFRMLKAYVQSIFGSLDELTDPALAHTMGEHIVDLVRLGFRRSPAAAEASGLKSARLAAVLAVIEQNYADPGLTPQAVASRANMSVRYLHQLLELQGESFGRRVLALRMKRAGRRLADTAAAHLQIAQIAYDCGFNDLSYFNRCFRAQFGMTPSEYRRSARS